MSREKACKSCFICILQERRADVIEPLFPELGHAHALGATSFLTGVDVTLLLHNGGGSPRVETCADLLPGRGRDVKRTILLWRFIEPRHGVA
jgi:hypothetical protein